MFKLSILVGKSTILVSRLISHSGSALPGLVVEKTDSKFLKTALDQLPGGVILITGTNGKTTTTKIISDLLEAQGLRALTNRSGSNFVRGIISTIVKTINWNGHLIYDIAVFEQDEAYAVHFTKLYKPNGVVALNVGRDQLDRFGEIDKTAELIGKVVSSAKDFVVLNANDPRIASLKSKTKARTAWFGHSEKLAEFFVPDDQHHFVDKPKYFKAAEADVILSDFNSNQLSLTIGGKKHSAKTKLQGSQNALNIAAAIATIITSRPEITVESILSALSSVKPAFGRGELIKLSSGAQLRLQLVKNPASFTHNLRDLEEQKYGVIGIAINDDYPDGRDVSWLWDIDFADLAKQPGSIFCSGTRAYDMAVRLKYDEVPFKK